MNSTYTQQELLILSNYVYIPACMSEGTIANVIDRYRDASGEFTEESVLEAARGGGMSCADVKTVFTEMDKRIRENPDFGKLSVSRSLDEHDVRALCFTDEKDKNPVVVFRGTGGTKEAWTDNFDGAYQEDTRIQKVADDFIKNECAIYENIVVTGHSKGGNLAQYVTVRQNERISRCVSFDGQGFGDDFIKNNREQIEAAAPKICSVSAYNDFVNILLSGIAATTIYIENEPSAASAHSSVSILTGNTFDANGNIISTRRRGGVSGALDHITDGICDMLSPLSTKDKEKLATIAGSAIADALVTPEDRLMEDCVAPAMGTVVAALLEKIGETAVKINDMKPLCARGVYIDGSRMKNLPQLFRQQSDEMERIKRGVDEVRQNMAYTIASKICAENALEKVCYDISSIRSDIYLLADLVENVTNSYEKTEEAVCASVNL